MAATTDATATDYVPAGDLIGETFDAIEAASKRGTGMTGIPTGFMDLDKLTDGFQAGQFVIVAGRPASGKSTLGLDVIRSAAVRHQIPSVAFSLEMSRQEIMMRLLSAEARVALQRIRKGDLDELDWARLAKMQGPIEAAPLFIDDSPNMTLPQIRAKCRRLKARHGLKLVVVDYLQLMTSGKRVESRQQEVSEFSRALKLLAKELEVPVIAACQLNRGPEQRSDKKPLLADLRESGSLEQDADIVILLHREDLYDKESPRAGEADLIVAKHRNGPTDTITVASQLHYSRFVDLAS
jgi:replicative DNA helicase